MTNVFNVLGKSGFLRDQGILSLESVQEFYRLIGREPAPATITISNLLDLCHRSGYHELTYQPVIRLTMISSKTRESQGHAVVVHSYNRGDDYLVLLTIDSASETGYTFVFCSIMTTYGQQRVLTCQFLDQWCLASDQNYQIYFN